MNVFVTGGTGFVGAHLVKALRARGDRVTVLARRPALAAELGWGPEIRVLPGDLEDEAALREGRIVRDHDDGLPRESQLLENIGHNLTVLSIQISSGLVRKHNFGIVHERTRNCDALLLAAGKLAWMMIFASAKSD